MKNRKNLVKPSSHTLKDAEKELHSKGSSKAGKATSGYAVRNAKGVKEKGSKRSTGKRR